ncbi:MAG: cyclase [Ignavibacteriota bacterium]
MAYILIHHKVEDYKKWKPAFDAHASFRAENGSMGGKVFRSADDPNDLFVLLEINSIENGKKFVSSDATKEAMKNAGVVGMPSIYFVEEVATTTK